MSLPLGDNPVQFPSEDLLRRQPLAEALAQEIEALDASRGAVVAITGPWGSGKTSIMNLTADILCSNDSVTVVEFNPWLFSGAEQLAENLLAELSHQLAGEKTGKEKFKSVAKQVTQTLQKYSKAFGALRAVPVVGTVVDAASQALDGAAVLLSRDESLDSLRREAVKALETLTDLPGRVVVLVDDIDRLTRAETRDLFRTVRLSASFPNVVYLLCLDQQVVAAALDEEGFSGQDYLEKILTFTCRVPKLADHQVSVLFVDGLNEILGPGDTHPDDLALFSEAYPRILRPLIRTMRDAKRVLTALPLTRRLIGNELPEMEIVVMETLRTLYPQLHEATDTYAEALTEPTTSRSRSDASLKSDLDHFIGVDWRFKGKIAKALIELVFVRAADRLDDGNYGNSTPRQDGIGWSKARLDYYLSHELPPGEATAATIRDVISAFGSERRLRRALESVPDEALPAVLDSIWSTAPDVPAGSVGHIVPVLLQLIPRLPRRTAGSALFMDPVFSVLRPILVMVRKLDADQIAELVARVIEKSGTIYEAYSLLKLVGHEVTAGAKQILVSQDQYLKDKLRERIEAAGTQLSDESRLLEVLIHTIPKRAAKPALDVLMEPAVAATVLASAISTTTSQTIVGKPTQAVETYGLHWDTLVEVFGGEDNLRSIAATLQTWTPARADADYAKASTLLDAYLEGWRPPSMFDRD